jgi:SAM-dependent methyltransferase
LPKLYEELASWWPLLSAPEDYAEEAAFYTNVLKEACESPPRTVLELGSGGGNNSSHMKANFELTLSDVSPGMLAVSRALNPELEHIQGDMRSVRLGREFDAVFVHDAISYLTTLEDVRAAVETAFLHCRAGGAALFCPDYTRETFRPETDHGGHDGADGRALRYLEWCYDPDPDDTTYTTDFAYLLREADGAMRVEHDRHIDGLFTRDEWLTVIRDVGFEPSAVPFEHSEVDRPMEVFIGHRPRPS